ncbi:hypothetical protein FBU30_010078 [Linnemannia zychae]|nr:hypothetical protein FBU30_010078 [Linnemannia zychae]
MNVRNKALGNATKKVLAFEKHVESGDSIRGQEFIDIKKSLKVAFYWNPEVRSELTGLLRNADWSIIECETKADVRIAGDCQKGDIVISCDPDFVV